MDRAAIITTCIMLSVRGVKVENERQFECGAEFSCVVESTAFVDKSLLIKEFLLKAPKSVLTTAPSCFGKSTNIDMLKRFFEIEVDERGYPKTKANYTRDPVTDTGNYDMFVRNEVKITRHANIMEEHFGRHPVITVDFKYDKISSYNDTVDCCKRVIHKAFLQHKYLLQSKTLGDEEKRICKKWCEYRKYVHSNESDVRSGLSVLSRYLYKHFKRRKVFVFIDEYDSLITSAMFMVKDEEELRRIIEFNVGIVADVLEVFSDSVIEQGFITGASDIASIEWYKLSNVIRYKFLERHPFVDFYGVTKGEISNLFTKPEFTVNLNVEDAAQLARNGHTSQTGRKMYSLYSLLV